MDDPVIAQKTPLAVDVEEGKTYYWCSCGQSSSQPFCDGSHKGTEFTPKQYVADDSGTKYFCACKHTATSPMCDGSHSKL